MRAKPAILTVFTTVDDYQDPLVEAASGDKPTEGEVVGAALTELFKLDRGFQRWKDRSQKPDASSQKAGELTSPSKA